MLIVRTIISRRLACWTGSYHHCLSSGCLGSTLSLSFSDESFEVESLARSLAAKSLGRVTVMLFSSFTFHFSDTCLPSWPRAEIMSRFDFLPCWTVRVVSAVSVISFWKVFLFLGSSFSSLASFFFSLLSLVAFFVVLAFVFFSGAFLKRSFTFLRNGEWL